MSEVTMQVDLKTLSRIRECLSAAKENAEELLSAHEQRVGGTKKSHKLTTEMYESEIEECRFLMDETALNQI